MNGSSARYLSVLLGLCGAVLALALGLNLALGERALGSAEATRLASAWQEASKGVTYSPPTTHTRPFKSHRLVDRLPGINGIVLGSSTTMGLTESIFPEPLRVYNFSLTANATATIAGEAAYLERHHGERVRWMLVGLDWAIGTIYHPGEAAAVDLAPEATLSVFRANAVPLLRKLADALSLPRVINLGKALRAVLASGTPLQTFRHTFFDVAGEEYRCPDGRLARDFDVVNRGLCLGFRYDGSWTFGGERRLTVARAAVLARAAAAPSSKFSRFLCATRGEPNPAYLERLGEVARRMAARGGRMLFLLPPNVPGMEREMQKMTESAACLARTLAVLGAWAERYGVTIIDAGESERYGCVAGEFLDEHHAYPECHAKVFARYFRDSEAGQVRAGLYRPAAS
jgi:hypothetical protein